MVLKVTPSEARLIQVLTNQDRVDLHAMGRDVNRATAMSVSSVESSSRRRAGAVRTSHHTRPDQSEVRNQKDVNGVVHHAVVYSARDHPANGHRDGHRSQERRGDGRHSRSRGGGDRADRRNDRSGEGDHKDRSGEGDHKDRRRRHEDDERDRSHRGHRDHRDHRGNSRNEHLSRDAASAPEESPMQKEARELVQRKVVLAQIDMIKKVHGLKPEEPLATDASLSQCEWALFLLSRQVNMLQGCTMLGYILQGTATLVVTANKAVGKVLKLDDLEKDVREMCTTQQAVLARASLELPQLQMGPLMSVVIAFLSTVKHCHDRNSTLPTLDAKAPDGYQPADVTHAEADEDEDAPDMLDVPDMFEMSQ